MQVSRRVAAIACVTALVAVAGCSSDPEADTPSSAVPSRSTTATGSPSPSDQALARFYSQKATWKDCRDGYDCARIDVPLDYADPGGKTIEISVNRRPAGSDSKRIGSLLVNPGGPGASGLDYARAGSGIVSKSLLERYDLVGFDPRGWARARR